MAKADNRFGLLKAPNDTRPLAEIAAQIVSSHPIELEERIGTLSKPLIIESACPGWQPRIWPVIEAYRGRTPPNYEEGGIRYPAVPCTIEDQVREVVDAVRAGAAAAHIHPRDPKDCFASASIELLSQVYERIFAEVDVISFQHTWEMTATGEIDFLRETIEALELAGGSNRYVQGCLVLFPPGDSYPKGYRKSAREGVEYFQKHKIKPLFKYRSAYHGRELHRFLKEISYESDGPLVVCHDMGHPFGWPMDIDTWMPMEMIIAFEQTKERFPDAVTGVFSGGRNWLPITLTAILAGVDIVQVGIEDCYWMYPHKDEVIQNNMDCVRKITEFCRLIGRPIATVDQARQITGITRT